MRLVKAGLLKFVGCGLLIGAAMQSGEASAQSPPVDRGFGNLYKPFRADSPWNSRPVNPVFGTYQIPRESGAPVVNDGPYSTGVFPAATTDAPMTIYGPSGKPGILDADAGYTASITLPRWPANVIPASGTDGHADIFDEVTGIIHSFYKLRKENGNWVATNYGWSRIDGTGWGDPAHYSIGVRAVGVVPMAGIIRSNEIDDNGTEFNHALAMSLAASAFSKTYIYPATSTDDNVSANIGQLPYGALLMLPPTFDDSAITIPTLKKVVATLRKYGAYVVDRNENTGFAIYVENREGKPFQLSNDTWAVRSAQLELIRAGLRQVTSAAQWLDGNGLVKSAPANQNLLSLRGPYIRQTGPNVGRYETWQQAVVFPAATAQTTLAETQNKIFTPVVWAKPAANANVKFTAVTTGGASTRLIVHLKTGEDYFDSGLLPNGASVIFAWPANVGSIWGVVRSGIGSGSTASGTLIVQ